MIINHFLYHNQYLLFDIRMTQEISESEVGNGNYLGMANYNIYFKINFNCLVMNITQTKFFTDKMCIYET